MNMKFVTRIFAIIILMIISTSAVSVSHAQTATSSNPQPTSGRPPMPPQGGDRMRRSDDMMSGQFGTTSTTTDGMRRPMPRGGTISTTTSQHTTPPALPKLPQQGTMQTMHPVVIIDDNGHIALKGTLVSVNGQVLTVKAWGLVFTVDTNGATTTSVTVGDTVGIQGDISDSLSGHIVAKNVRDITLYKPVDDRTSPTNMTGTNTNDSNHPMMPQNEGVNRQSNRMPMPRPAVSAATQQSQVSAGGVFDFLNNLFRVR